MTVVYSQNHYTADDRSVIAAYSIPGTTERIAVRKGSAGVLLLDLLGFINAEVVKLQVGGLDEWGYAERPIRGSTTVLSNHASGTAVDVNARTHPLGKTGTWDAAAKAKIHARLALYDGTIRWGEDYHGRIDGMHFELVAGPAAVIAVANRIRQGTLGHGAYSYLVGRARFHNDTHIPEEPHYNVRADPKYAHAPRDGVRWVQMKLGIVQSGLMDTGTVAALKSFQKAHRLDPDGVAGPITKGALRHVR